MAINPVYVPKPVQLIQMPWDNGVLPRIDDTDSGFAFLAPLPKPVLKPVLPGGFQPGKLPPVEPPILNPWAGALLLAIGAYEVYRGWDDTESFPLQPATGVEVAPIPLPEELRRRISLQPRATADGGAVIDSTTIVAAPLPDAATPTEAERLRVLATDLRRQLDSADHLTGLQREQLDSWIELAVLGYVGMREFVRNVGNILSDCNP